jgi:signal transduction histidine kinase
MIANALSDVAWPFVASVGQWWRDLGRARKLTAALSIGIICATIYAGSVLGQHIQDLFANKAGASTALHMDSVVEPLVQELVAKPSLSEQNRAALERMMSPASSGKPIVAFRIWVHDRIVFSSRGEFVGKRFPATPARTRAFEGDVVASLGFEGDYDDNERALHAPILEIYAPVRQTGTSKIIALAETSELAIDLMREIQTAQYTSYAVLASGAIGLILVLFSLTGGLQKEIGELARQRVQDKQFNRRVCHANRHVLEINEKNLRRVGEELYAGPLQLVAFAQLRLDSLREAPDKVGEEVDAISAALKECMSQIRQVSTGLSPSDLRALSLPKVIGTAICLHEARTATTVTCEFLDVPQEAPYALKSCLYQFTEQTLGNIFRHSAASSKIHVYAKCEGDRLDVELVCRLQPALGSRLADAIESGGDSVRHRIEALGGVLSTQSDSDQHVSVIASFWTGEGSDRQ